MTKADDLKVARRRLGQAFALSAALARSLASLEAAYVAFVAIQNPKDLEAQKRAVGRSIPMLRSEPTAMALSLMMLHFATLYPVVEKWRHWRFADAEVDALLASPLVGDLKDFRNAVLHADPVDDKRVQSFINNPERSEWISALRDALERALRQWHENAHREVNAYISNSETQTQR